MNSSRPTPRPPANRVYPVAAALLVFGALYAFVAYRLLRLTEGHLVYALDDAYIHMAIAKNLALHGVWGVQQATFSASSSSPLWTLLLSAWFRSAGVSDMAPLVLNTVLGVASVVIIGFMLRSERLAGLPLFAVLVATILLAPLVPLVWTGMEHTLHIALTVLAAWQLSALVRNYTATGLTRLCIVAALMVAARYEGLFVVAGCCCVLALHRRVAGAAFVAVAGALPVIAVGFWNVSHGWFFLPASILMKQAVLGAGSGPLVSRVLVNITSGEVPLEFFALVLGALVLAAYQGRSSGTTAVHPLLIVFLIAALFHLMLARFGNRWRYESYLMVLGALSTAVASLHLWPGGDQQHTGVAGDLVSYVAMLGVLIFGSRTLASNAVVANTAGHIYRQQYQVARFVGQYYDEQPVALNDIGNVSYYTRARVSDLMGLGSVEMARLRRSATWDAPHINDLLRRDNAQIAVIYDSWFSGGRAFQREWLRVGQWVTDVEDEPVEGTVTFFAANPAAAATLRASLLDFNRALPASLVSTRIDEPHDSNR